MLPSLTHSHASREVATGTSTNNHLHHADLTCMLTGPTCKCMLSSVFLAPFREPISILRSMGSANTAFHLWEYNALKKRQLEAPDVPGYLQSLCVRAPPPPPMSSDAADLGGSILPVRSASGS